MATSAIVPSRCLVTAGYCLVPIATLTVFGAILTGPISAVERAISSSEPAMRGTPGETSSVA